MPKIIDLWITTFNIRRWSCWLDCRNPLRESLKSRNFSLTDFANSIDLLLCMLVSRRFRSQRPKHRVPRAAEYGRCFYCSSAGQENRPRIDEKIVAELSYQATGMYPHRGCHRRIVATRVPGRHFAKFHPVVQQLYFDSLESLPRPSTEQDVTDRYALRCKPLASAKASNKIAIIAIPCVRALLVRDAENWSMMGLHLVRMESFMYGSETIEKSNWTDSFCSGRDVGSSKPSAAAAVAEMNPDLKGHIVSKQEPVVSHRK